MGLGSTGQRSTWWSASHKAMSAFNGKGYQAALEALGDAVERDFRIVEGVE